MERGFNCIELSIQRHCPSNKILRIFLEGEFLLFEGEFAIENFLEVLKKKRKKYFLLFSNDSTSLFPEFLNVHQKNIPESEFDFFCVKNKVYYFVLKIKGKTLHIKSLNNFLPQPFENFIDKDYTFLPYWDSKEVKKEENERVVENVADFWRLKWRDINTPPITDFWGPERGGEERSLQLLEKDSEEVKIILTKNLDYLKNSLLTLHLSISEILPRWVNQSSIASISKKIFKNSYNSYSIQIENTLELDKSIRPGFYGGICSVFGNVYSETETVYHFDFSNMYGNLMLEDFPTGNLIKVDSKNFLEPGFWHTKVYSQTLLPILPHKRLIHSENYQREGLFFTNGTFEALQFNEELQFFLSKEGNKVLECSCGHKFEGENRPIFKRFAEEMIELRSIGNSKIWKQILVSLFGALGMSPIETKTILLHEKEYEEGIKNFDIVRECWFSNQCLVEVKTETKKVGSLVHYAAIITSRARIKLHKAIESVTKQGGRLLYCDTDSLFVAFPKKQKVLGEKHGDVFWDPKKKDTQLADAVFASTRSYSIKKLDGSWETKIAGTPRNSVSFDTFKKEFYSPWRPILLPKTNLNVFKFEEWQNFTEADINFFEKRIFSEDKKKTFSYHKIGDIYEKDPYNW